MPWEGAEGSRENLSRREYLQQIVCGIPWVVGVGWALSSMEKEKPGKFAGEGRAETHEKVLRLVKNDEARGGK